LFAGGQLFVYDARGGGGRRAYDAVTGTQATAGRGHWNSPIVVDGRIALRERNANRRLETGVLDIWAARP
jgi:hypothetical protein